MDRQRFVHQYVQRQRAYLPTYTAEHLLNERPGTPAKPIHSDQFGFDTPVLRPRVPTNKTTQPQKLGPSESRARKNKSGLPPGPSPAPGPSEPSLDKPRPKRKKAPTPVDTDSEHVARLADRRERKRKKRAIVNPPQKHDEDGVRTASKKERTKGQKTKKPAALALLYGFSATNVTKDRLTVKPAPSLGVFSKGKASEKKKVTATKKSSSKSEFFSEFTFLNKSNGRVADHSKVDDNSSVSSTSDPSDRMPQATRATKRTKKDRSKCTETTAPKTPHASTGTTAESEVWDIELESKLPSTARGVSSEPGANDSASVVLKLFGAEWSASLNAAREHEECHNHPRTRSMSITESRSIGPHPVLRSSSLARSDLCNEPGVAHGVNEAPSIHPSHSASQVGRRAADIQPSDLQWPVRSRYFTHPEPVAIQQASAELPQASRSNDSLDVLDTRIPDQDVQTILRVTSPINSLVSAGQPLAEFRSRYDVAPLEFPSDCSYDDWYSRVHGAVERFEDHGNLESSVVEMQSDRFVGDPACHGPHGDVVVETPGVEYYHPQQDLGCCASPGLADDDVAYQGYDPLATEYENDLEESIAAGELADDPRPYSVMYEDEGSMCWDGESGVGMPRFWQGRALLLGVPGWSRRDGLSGLAQAEMDVASRLRDHWRPLRLW